MDRVLITMPESPREFFLAMPVVQDYLYQYVQEVSKGMRDRDYQFTFRMHDCYEKYEAPLKVAKDVTPEFDYTGWSQKRRYEFHCFIDFDFPAAEKIARCTGKHITESLGVLIGSSPRKWPILPPVDILEHYGILIQRWDGEESIRFEKCVKHPLGVVGTYVDNDPNPHYIASFDCIVGKFGLTTYLAAALGKTVIEIFPDKEKYCLYNNEGISNYRAIIGSPVTAENVIESWNDILADGLNLEDAESFL